MSLAKLKISRYPSLIIVQCMIIGYVLNDMWNSGNMGLSDANRGSVYIFLISMIFVMLFYIIFRGGKNAIYPPYYSIMVIITGWILFDNYLLGRLNWIAYVHLFMTVWWLVSFSYFTKYLKNNSSSKYLILVGFYLIMCMYFVITVYSSMSLHEVKDVRVVGKTLVLNYAYFVLVFFPYTFLYSGKYQNFAVAGIAVLLLFSMKRGPLIIMPLMYLTYIYSQSRLNGRLVKAIPRILLFVIIAGICFYIADNLSDGFLSHRFEKDQLADGSNRSVMWSMAIEAIDMRDPITILTGAGSGSSIELVGSGIHNEWLEFMFSFGAIGVLLYFIFGILLISRYKYFMRQRSPYAPLISMQCTYFWTVGMFSGFYFTHSSFYFFAFLAIVEALNYNSRRHGLEKIAA